MQGAVFKDVRVRQAATYALDKKLIIDKILGGTAAPIDGILSPDAFGANPTCRTMTMIRTRPRRLLAEAGYPDGIDVTMDVEGAFKDTAEAVASLLTKAGIRTKVPVGEGAAAGAEVAHEGRPEGPATCTSPPGATARSIRSTSSRRRS